MPAYKNERGTYYAKFRYIDWQGNKKQKKKEGFKTKIIRVIMINIK